MKKSILFVFALFFGYQFSKAQLVVNNTTMTPEQLVQNILGGPGVTISNVVFNGVPATTVSQQVGEFNGTASNIGLANGVIMGSGDVQVAVGPNNQGGASLGVGGSGNDPDLNAISTNTLYHQAILEFDFVPIGDTISFRYIFASEEYNEYVCSGFNDVFGFFISGPGIAGPYTNGAENIALVPGTTTAVAINTINPGVAGSAGTPSNCAAIDPNWTSYSVYHVTNTQQSVQYDAWTVPLTAKRAVQCNQTYHIKLAIADAGDGAFDSGVFLEAGSFSSVGLDVNLTTVSGNSNIIEGCTDGATFTFTRPDTTTSVTVTYDINGTATNGTDYNNLPGSITFNAGEDSVDLNITTLIDALPEGTETLIITVYTISPCGDTIPKSDTLYINDPDPVVADAGPDQSVTCPGSAVNLNGNASGGLTPYQYSWSTGANTQNTSFQPLQTSTVILTVTDVCLQEDTDTIVVTVPPYLPLDVSSPDITVVCPGDDATLVADFNGGGSAPYSFMWNTGDTDTVITVNPLATTTYNFTVTDNCGLDTTINVTVTVPQYIIDIETIDGELCSGNNGEILLPVTVTGGAGGNSYVWTTTTSSSITVDQATGNATVENAVTGNYYVAVMDQCGNMAADTSEVVVIPCEITIPNVFTPNGDGANDTFYIENLDAHPNSHVMIFNRWGNLIYEDANYQNNWTAPGVSDGVYFYIVHLTDGFEPAEHHGNVHIFRLNKN